MITEALILGICGIAYCKFKNRHLTKFKKDWKNLMLELGLKNKSEQTYEILDGFTKNYGCDCIVGIPKGKSVEDFNKKLPQIQTFLKGNIIAEPSENKNTIYMRFTNDLESANKQDKIKFKWYKIMTANKLRNEEFETFKITKVELNELYGFTLNVDIPYGLGFEKLKAIKNTLESNFNSMIELEWDRFNNKVKVKVIEQMIKDNFKFEPYKLDNAMNIYSGYSLSYNRLVSDMFKQPHILVSGASGSGKTELIRMMITNLINNFNENELELFFSDLSDMCDFECFQKCKQVRYYAKSLKKSQILFKRLFEVYKLRFDIFVQSKCKNIKEYNKKFPQNKMTVIYLVLDEFADYFPSSSKIDKNYNVKLDCYNMLKGMTRKFRKAGMFLIVGIQRPDTTVLDPSLRSNLCTKIGFSQNTDSSSLVASDSTELTGLEQREGLFMVGNKREWFKSLYIDDKLIKKYTKQSKDMQHKYIDIFKDEEFIEYLEVQYGLKKEDIKQIDTVTTKTIKNKINSKTNKKTSKEQEIITTSTSTIKFE